MLRLFQLRGLPPQTRIAVQTIAFGLLAALGAVAFQRGITVVYDHTFKRFAAYSLGQFLLWSFVTMIGSSMIVGWLLSSFCPDAAGSGIPQLKVAFWKDFGYVPWRTVWVKFVAGVLSIGGGSSLGREGPSVHLAGGTGSVLAGMLGEAKQNRRRGAAAGAAAGLAAAFNTPLAAITFVLEEIVEDLNSRLLGSVLLASLIGAFVVHGLVGKQPAFSLARLDSPLWVSYLLAPFIAACASLVGITFQNSTLRLRAMQREKFRAVPRWMRPAIGALIAWGIGVAVFAATGRLGVFSLGYEDLSEGLTTGLGWKIAALLLVTKLAATILCYGFGGCGGIFSPTLFLGAMCGLAISGLVGLINPAAGQDATLAAVVGMSACLAAVVRAPLTGILIVFEMTHQFSLVPALMISALTSQAISRRMTRFNFYEAILDQDGHHLKRIIPPKDLLAWRNAPAGWLIQKSIVSVDDISPTALKRALQEHPYRQFPVRRDGTVIGILTRKEAEAALSLGREPILEPAIFCGAGDSVGSVQARLLESPSGVAIALDEARRPIGIITLHDLLRGELAAADGLMATGG